MKSAFIRMMAVAVLATSISGFAASENPRSKDNNAESANVGNAVDSNVTLDTLLEKLNQLQAQIEQLQARDKEREREQQTNQEDIDKMIKQQDKHWNDSLLGIYGG